MGVDPESRPSLNPGNLSLPVAQLHSRYDLVTIGPEIMHELSISQPSFGSLGLKTIHRMIDDYSVRATEFGTLLSERTVGIIWKTLMLPGPTLRKLVLIPVNLSLPQYCRIQ